MFLSIFECALTCCAAKRQQCRAPQCQRLTKGHVIFKGPYGYIKKLGEMGGPAHMVGEGEASKLKNRHFLGASGHFSSKLQVQISLLTRSAMSGELKSVEKSLVQKDRWPWRPFLRSKSKNLKLDFWLWNWKKSFLTKMAPTTHGYFVLRFSQLISALLTWPNAWTKNWPWKIEHKCPEPSKKYLFF